MSVDERVFPSSFKLSTKAAANLNEAVPSPNPPFDEGNKFVPLSFSSSDPATLKCI